MVENNTDIDNEIKTRKEILFLYEVIDCNPNGDPLEGNKVRVDSETQQAIVTDVRLKRTVRDYLLTKNNSIFVRPVLDSDGKLLTKKSVLNKDLQSNITKESVLAKYVDLRLFGATIAEEGARITVTGPVQFRFGRTLHAVEPQFYKGTTVFPSKEGNEQGTFTDIHKIPYGLIAFYGVINENAAKDTQLTQNDVDLLYDALWNGTKNLATRSKLSHMPKLLIIIDYKEANFFIGDIDRLITANSSEKPRQFSQVGLNCDNLLTKIDDVKEKIEKIIVYTGESNKKEIKEGFKELSKVLTELK